PFTLADDRPRLYIAGKPQKQRQKLSLGEFWAIYDSAGKLGYECLQIAMGISLTTFMRQDDILQLRLKDDLENDLLKKVISKSFHQRGAVSAARLMWDTGNYELLRQLIRRAREMSLKNARCPFVVSHRPLVRLPSDQKEHPHQVLPRRLQDMFAESREAAGI